MNKIIFALCISAIAGSVESAEFYLLDSLLGDGPFSNHAYAASADGSKVAVNHSNESGHVWTTGTTQLTSIPDLPGGGNYVMPNAISSDGAIVVGQSGSAQGAEGFIWSASNGTVGLGDLPGGLGYSIAYGVSADGTVAAGVSRSGTGDEAFRWTAENGMVGLGDLPGGSTISRAFGISGDGSTIVGTSYSSNGQEAFKWTSADGIVGLGDLDGLGFISTAKAAAYDGSTIVGAAVSAQGTEAFMWTSDTGMVGLGGNGNGFVSSVAESVSADGNVVGGFGWGEAKEAFVWTKEEGIQRVIDVAMNAGITGLDGYTLTTVEGISADGSTLVGYALNPDGKFEGWVMTGFSTVPVPGAVWLFGSAVALLGWVRRKPA